MLIEKPNNNQVFKWICSVLAAITLSLAAAWGNNVEARITRQTERIDLLSMQLSRIEAHQDRMILQLDTLIQIHQQK